MNMQLLLKVNALKDGEKFEELGKILANPETDIDMERKCMIVSDVKYNYKDGYKVLVKALGTESSILKRMKTMEEVSKDGEVPVINIPATFEELLNENDIEKFNDWIVGLVDNKIDFDNEAAIEAYVKSLESDLVLMVRSVIGKLFDEDMIELEKGINYLNTLNNADMDKLKKLFFTYLEEVCKNALTEKDFGQIMTILTETFNGRWEIRPTSMSNDKQKRTGFLIRNTDNTSLILAPVYRKKKIVALRVSIGGSVMTEVKDMVWGEFNIKDTEILHALDTWMAGNNPFNIENKTLVLKKG